MKFYRLMSIVMFVFIGIVSPLYAQEQADWDTDISVDESFYNFRIDDMEECVKDEENPANDEIELCQPDAVNHTNDTLPGDKNNWRIEWEGEYTDFNNNEFCVGIVRYTTLALNPEEYILPDDDDDDDNDDNDDDNDDDDIEPVLISNNSKLSEGWSWGYYATKKPDAFPTGYSCSNFIQYARDYFDAEENDPNKYTSRPGLLYLHGAGADGSIENAIKYAKAFSSEDNPFFVLAISSPGQGYDCSNIFSFDYWSNECRLPRDNSQPILNQKSHGFSSEINESYLAGFYMPDGGALTEAHPEFSQHWADLSALIRLS